MVKNPWQSSMQNTSLEKYELRQYTLNILMSEFGSTHSNKDIYECADEWCSKQVTTNGLVSYFRAYYAKNC